MALADDGYFDQQENFDTNPSENELVNVMKGIALARHETINRRLKRWGVLGQKFRHNLSTHKDIANAVANLVQMEMLYEDPAFEVPYVENVNELF